MFNSFRSTRHTKKKDDYLKYHEGEVVTIESKEPTYPPFLKEDAEESEVKYYKDMIKKQDTEDSNSHLNLLDTPNNKRKESEGTTNSKQKEPGQKTRSFSKIIMPLTWTLIIGGLIYYSIPIFTHFTSETPDVGVVEDAMDKTKEQINDTGEQLSNHTDTISHATEVVGDKVEDVKEGSGIVETTKDHLSGNDGNSEDGISISPIEWANFLSSVHNEKQQSLLKIRNFTQAFVNEEISYNKYRFKMNGVEKDLNRQKTRIEDFSEGKSTNSIQGLLSLVSNEVDYARQLAVALSSLAASDVVERYNVGIQEQNTWNKSYRDAFTSFLEVQGIEYTEQDGKISY